jgi:predicted flap endonuclease-1-like 5' DNA nuclease
MISADASGMMPLIIAIAVVLLAVAICAFLRANRTAKVIEQPGETLKRDVLDEGAERAARNQALIDAAPAVAKAAPETAAEPSPAPPVKPAPAAASGDDLTRIKGLGPKIATLLSELGITSFAQIAAWSDDDVTKIDDQLGRFKGRITRDQWVVQAKLLAAGDEASFAEQFGNNG